ncbi:MAG: hypothetical protein WBG08_00815 [Litorimonas sp.]
MTQLVRNIAVLIVLALFTLPAVGFVAGLAGGGERVSETERRRLAEVPRFDGDARAYTSAFDTYLEDSFGFRMLLIRTARKVRDNLGEDPPSVVTGKEGWLFLGNNPYRDEFEGQGLWDDAQVEAWVSGLSEMRAALAERNIPFAAYIAVDKARVYPEFLPDDWTESPRRFRAAVHAHPEAAETDLIDAERYLRDAKARGVKVFYKRDSHWTPDGTLDLAHALLEQLDPWGTRPRHSPAPPRLQSPERLLDLEGLAGFAETSEPLAMMIDRPPAQDGFLQIDTPDAETPKERRNFPTWRMAGTPEAPAGRLVVVGDSFSDAVMEHLRVSYAEIVRLHHGAHVFDVSLEEILSERPDAVLFATAERQAAQKARPFAR